MLGNGGNDRDVSFMNGRQKERGRAALRVVEAYWHGLSQHGEVPLRSEVDPRGMERALENAFLLERIAPSMAKIRVAGSHLSDLMGMQISGMPLSSLIAPADREAFGKAVARLFADPAIVRITLTAESGFGKPDMTAEMLLMPLRSDFGEVSRALGVLVTDGRIGRTPRRFTLASVDVAPAITAIPSDDTTPVALQDPQEPVGKSRLGGLMNRRRSDENPALDAAKQPPRPVRRHLRLVVSND